MLVSVFFCAATNRPMHKSLKIKLEARLAKLRSHIIENIRNSNFDVALMQLDESTYQFMIGKQDYDRYRITPYSQEVTENYRLDGYVNASVVETHTTCYLAAQMPKKKYFGLFRDFIRKSGACLIISLIDCADEDYFNVSERVSAKCILPEDGDRKDCESFYDETYNIGVPVRRLRFCSWRDHMSPDPDSFRAFYDYFRKAKCKKIIVHCHAGVGRTGTFIMYDMLHEKEKVTLNVFVDTLLYLRSCRPCMVFKPEQLEFLARSLLPQNAQASETCNQKQKELLHHQ